MTEYKIEKITWIDSYGCTPNWEDLEDLIILPAIATSVGFNVKEDDLYIVLAPNLAESNENINSQITGHMAIPICSITRREKIG